MKQRKIVSDRRLKASAMEWAKVALRVSEYYLSEKRDARIVTLTRTARRRKTDCCGGA